MLDVRSTEAPRIFLQFQTHIERLLDKKIKCVQSDWGGEYQKIHNQFFCSLGNTHRVSFPLLINKMAPLIISIVVLSKLVSRSWLMRLCLLSSGMKLS